MEFIEKALYDIAGFMAVAAKTAPKAKGIDKIETVILEKKQLGEFAEKMKEYGKKTKRPDTFNRDAGCVINSTCLVIIGTSSGTLGLDCGFCGLADCAEAQKYSVTCSYNSGDLGIAVGSAAATAASFHADNRIMYTAGLTAVKYGYFADGVKMALGIPLSATGKNIFFDR